MATPWSNPGAARALFSARIGLETGAIAQDPILQPGRYWQYFKTPEAAVTASAWFVAQEQMGNCSIVNKAGDPTVGKDNFFVMWDVPAGRMMPWPQVELGFPQIADPQTATKRTEVDHSLPPEPPTLGGSLDAAVGSAANVAGNAIGTAITAGAVLLGVYVVIQALK